MKRLLRKSLVVISLLLCLGSVMLWGMSYFWHVEVRYSRGCDAHDNFIPVGYEMNVDLGRAFVGCRSSASEQRYDRGFWFYSLDPEQQFDRWSWRDAARFLWFDYNFEKSDGVQTHAVAIPLWLPTFVLSILPLLTLRTHLRVRREKNKGLCPHCGYDLRATPERCPECGAASAEIAETQRRREEKN